MFSFAFGAQIIFFVSVQAGLETFAKLVLFL